jgi:Mg-chelatase subunit ChlD
LDGIDTVKLVYQAAEDLRKNELPLLVIDTENSIFGMGIGARIAELADGAYVKCAE